jgi:hypothetical protein
MRAKHLRDRAGRLRRDARYVREGADNFAYPLHILRQAQQWHDEADACECRAELLERISNVKGWLRDWCLGRRDTAR